MPKSKDQYIRFQIIDRELRRWPSIKTSRLVKIISEFLGKSIDIRTVQKDIEAMRFDKKLGFNAPIEYDTRKKEYRYTDDTYSISKFNLEEKEVKALKFYAQCLGLYSGYSIFNDFSSAIQKVVDGVDIRKRLLNESNPGLVIQTDTVSYAKGNEHLTFIVEAIIERQYISFDYQKYTDTKTTNRVLAPLLLKEYKNRWYVVGLIDQKKKVSTFALDRISNLKGTAKKMEHTISFDPSAYFKHSFGITTVDNADVEEVVLRFSKSEAPYIRSLPIHPTQKIKADNRGGLTISIQIIPSYEFYEYILGKTPDVEVLSPKHVAEKVQAALTSGLTSYKH